MGGQSHLLQMQVPPRPTLMISFGVSVICAKPSTWKNSCESVLTYSRFCCNSGRSGLLRICMPINGLFAVFGFFFIARSCREKVESHIAALRLPMTLPVLAQCAMLVAPCGPFSPLKKMTHTARFAFSGRRRRCLLGRQPAY